jgi:hypothetical protein
MSTQQFSLQPFPAPNLPRGLQLTATITRESNVLAVRYQLDDPGAQIVVPPRAESPARKHHLWQTTCFEFFVAARGELSYWEFNLASSGDWNVYRLESYRAGLREESTFGVLPFYINRQADCFTLEIEIDLGKIIAPTQAIELSATAVIEDAGGTVSYWAIAHRGEKPDFHVRESFIVKLTADRRPPD